MVHGHRAVNHHGLADLPWVDRSFIILHHRLIHHRQIHVDVVHHFGEDYALTAVVLNTEVEKDLVSEVVSSSIDESVASAVALRLLWRLDGELDLEAYTRCNIFLDHKPRAL